MVGFTKLGVAAVAAISLAGAAFAASITPDGPFQADGGTNLTKGIVSLACTAHFAGTVTGGIGSVTSASFTGGPLNSCTQVVAVGLPWTVTATSATGGTISGVAVNTPIGNCTAGTIAGTYNNSTHVLSFSGQTLPGGCVVSGNLTTHDNALTLTN